MQQVKAKKSLGQHFLTDKNIAKKIVDALTLEQSNSILEIGPGTGILTRYLLENDRPFFAVEIDKESVEFIKNEFHRNDFIIEGDFIKTNLSRFPSPISIIGNFPYYISSQIFFKLLDNINVVNEVVCMLQKEVAERITSPPGNKVYGILSVLLQSYFKIDYLFTVHEHCFNPPPKVKSAVIRLMRNERTAFPCDFNLFKQVVKQSFNQRRKTLRNSLKNICINLDFGMNVFNKRPEQLSVEEFIELASYIENCINTTI